MLVVLAIFFTKENQPHQYIIQRCSRVVGSGKKQSHDGFGRKLRSTFLGPILEEQVCTKHSPPYPLVLAHIGKKSAQHMTNQISTQQQCCCIQKKKQDRK